MSRGNVFSARTSGMSLGNVFSAGTSGMSLGNVFNAGTSPGCPRDVPALECPRQLTLLGLSYIVVVLHLRGSGKRSPEVVLYELMMVAWGSCLCTQMKMLRTKWWLM